MNIKKTLFSALLALGCMTATAQQATTEYVFNPHWYVQGQFGGQYTLGEISFDKLLSMNAQLGVGYNFNSVVGARLSVNAWQSKGGSKIDGITYKWKWNYIAPMVDATFNLSNLICGFNPNRVVNVGVFAGIGANIAFNNDDAVDADRAMLSRYTTAQVTDQFLRYLWTDTKTRLAGRAGATVDFRLSDKVSLGLELQASTMNDRYNSKKAGNADWTFNALVGVKYNFGKTYETRTITPPAPIVKEKIVEKVVEKIVEKPAPVVEKVVVAPLRRDIFFLLNKTNVRTTELQKVQDIADYLKANPSAKVQITGYADKGTGNAKINRTLSDKRAAAIVALLTGKYGVSADRISSDFKGDTEQPFTENNQNRVSVCIAQ